MTKQHYVRLTGLERCELEQLVQRRSTSPLTRRHARIVLRCDTATGGGNRTDQTVAQELHCTARQVARVRARFATQGLAAAIDRKARSTTPPRLLGPGQEARVVELALSPAPAGRAHWSLRLLATEVVAQGVVPAISRETVRQTLKRGAVRPR